MARITPEILRNHREKRELTLDDLAAEARVDRQTISRIERGLIRRNHQITVAKLAEALRISVDVLTGPVPPTQPVEASRRKSQIKLMISDQVRNALALVSERFNVKQSQIIELAPLLFQWAAEQSLQRRQERLEALERRLNEASELSGNFAHLDFLIANNARAEDELIPNEQTSISNQDLFARTINRINRADNYDEEINNPLSVFLRDLASQLSGLADFKAWDPDLSPKYHLCKEHVRSLVNGDETATAYILDGYVLIEEMPDNLKDPNHSSELADWVSQTGREKSQKELLSLLEDFK